MKSFKVIELLWNNKFWPTKNNDLSTLTFNYDPLACFLLKFYLICKLIQNSKFMGRPPTKPIKFRDGFYLEIRNRGANSGIKLHRTTKEQMLRTIKDYEQSKDVIILGESKNGKWVNKTPILHVVED